jgi:hypothetical protein
MTIGPVGLAGPAGRLADVQARVQQIEARIRTVAHSVQPGGVVGHAAQALQSPSPASGTVPSFTSHLHAQGTVPVRSAPGDWAARLPEAGRQWAGEIEAAATRHGVDPALFAALVWAESGFRPDAVSHAGARGLAQLMPATAAGLGVDPDDPVQNLDGGARFLRAQLDRFGREDLALAAYNAGPGRVVQAGGIPRIQETQAYVPRVLSYRAQLEGSA